MQPQPAQLSLAQQFRSFGGVFWIANWIELVERFAYYGCRVVLPVFMVASFADGGPELDHEQKGNLYAVWAAVQSFLPIFSGGFADRFGYKRTIALSTVLKIIGYLVMGYSIAIAESVAGVPLSEARAQGTDIVYPVFFAGAMFLACGTAIFKPGVQGLIGKLMPKQSASLGWAVFYQMVNIGGFLGPLIAGYLRVLDWQYVFLVCAAGIALNFVPLFFFKEPQRSEEELSNESPAEILYSAMKGLLEPRLFFFTIAFAGFWLMFYQLFDILPNFIDDWIDSRSVAAALQSFGISPPLINGGNLTQEWMINLNALAISLFAFAFGYLTGFLRPLTAIVIGIFISAVAIAAFQVSMSGYFVLGAIALFSVGEMSASPTKMRYLSGIAPPGKQGLYMGYVNFTIGIGWSIGSVLAGGLYQSGGDKVVLAKRYLVEELGQSAQTISALSKDQILPRLYELAEVDPFQARTLLWNTYAPYSMWWVFAAIGVASMIAVMIYNHQIMRADAQAQHPFNNPKSSIVLWFLLPIAGTLNVLSVMYYSDGLMINAVIFSAMMVVALYEYAKAD